MGEYSSDCDRATKKLRFKMSKIETQNPYKWTNVWNQYYATFAGITQKIYPIFIKLTPNSSLFFISKSQLYNVCPRLHNG